MVNVLEVEVAGAIHELPLRNDSSLLVRGTSTIHRCTVSSYFLVLKNSQFVFHAHISIFKQIIDSPL